MKALTSTLLIALIALLASCGSAKDISQPEFRDINNVKLVNVGLLQTTAGADLVYTIQMISVSNWRMRGAMYTLTTPISVVLNWIKKYR